MKNEQRKQFLEVMGEVTELIGDMKVEVDGQREFVDQTNAAAKQTAENTNKGLEEIKTHATNKWKG